MHTSTSIPSPRPKQRVRSIAAVSIVACVIFSAGIAVGQTRPREKASIGVLDEVCFRPIKGPAVDAGQGGALQASGLPIGWRMSATSLLQSTTSPDEPPATCFIGEELPPAFITALESLLTNRVLPRVQFRCKVP